MQARVLFVLLALAIAPAAHASTFDYNVNYNFGTFTVVGTITTDTNAGILADSNIVDWSLLLNDGTATLSLLGPASGNNSQAFISGSDVVASPASLTYDFDDIGYNALLFQKPMIGAGTNYLCYQGVGGGCNDFSGAHIAIQIGDGAVQEAAQAGVQVIASTATTAVPEPISLTLLGSGLVALISRARRKARG